ncbi:MAG: CrcB family protein [Pseudolysinimonas sp.]
MSAAIVVAALVAGAVGASARYGVAVAFAGVPRRLPLAVLLVNVAGSIIAGAVLAIVAQSGNADLRYIVLSGFAGGLTTFSTFGTETVQLVLEGRLRIAVASVAANVSLGAAAVAGAWWVTTALLT